MSGNCFVPSFANAKSASSTRPSTLMKLLKMGASVQKFVRGDAKKAVKG